jgi:hypothetical protein
VFLSQEVTLPLSFPVAQARLLRLARNGLLTVASGEAFVAGRGDRLGFGPFGEVPRATALVRVQFAEPTPHADLLVLPLRWEAMEPAGRLFPVLDADITLVPVGGPPAMVATSVAESDQTRLIVAGSYRPPTDGLGAMVSTGDIQHVAATTVCTLVHKIGDAICAGWTGGTAAGEAARDEAAGGAAAELGTGGGGEPKIMIREHTSRFP